MSNKQKFLERKKEANKANLEAHKQDILSGKKVRITANVLIRKK
jgi:hypothetical protein